MIGQRHVPPTPHNIATAVVGQQGSGPQQNANTMGQGGHNSLHSQGVKVKAMGFHQGLDRGRGGLIQCRDPADLCGSTDRGSPSPSLQKKEDRDTVQAC